MAEPDHGIDNLIQRIDEIDPVEAQRLQRLIAPELAPLPDWLEAAAVAVLEDFQEPTAVSVRLAYSADPEDSQFGMLWVIGSDDPLGRFGFSIETAARGAELLRQIADGLQNDFPECLAWGEARPACPNHPHPAIPEFVDGEAWWVCPKSERPIKPIGSRR